MDGPSFTSGTWRRPTRHCSPLFAAQSRQVETHAGIQPKTGHRVVEKSTVSIFASTDLARSPKEEGIAHLVICGLRTHACVARAARDAVPAGFEVVVAADACATRDIEVNSELRVDHATLHCSALAEIADTFGSAMSTEDVVFLAAP